MNKVNIILTVYNIKPSYLKESLKSIFNQSYQDFQIILVNDCSTVDYGDLFNHPKIFYLKNKWNLGLCRSVNKAFRNVNSKYVVRLGTDDLFHKDLLLNEVNFLENHDDYIACCSDLKVFGDAEKIIKRPKEFNRESVISIKSARGYGYAGGMMFRSTALKRFRLDETFRVCEDFDFHLQLLKLGKIKTLEDILYFYRKHDKGIMSSIERQERRAILKKIIRKHLRKEYD